MAKALVKRVKIEMKLAVFLVAMLASSLAIFSSAGAEPVNPAAIAGTCALCHAAKASTPQVKPSGGGPKGIGHSPLRSEPPGAMVALDGKTASAIEEAMQQFKTGARPATIMNRIAKGYSDEEIASIARYFGPTEP